MPPLRTLPPSKPMKTERTHEENQERAYIAASRRSDRSLEARVESARRASEIHKRRTGRSLRVTEQDVINEEMYEEEDDDLPMGYRRLTAHLQTGSADFNRRLTAYLTSHVAMRSALDQAIHPYAYPPSPSQMGQVGQSQPNLFPSPLMTQGLGLSPGQASPSSPRTAHPYRQTPYPMPGTPSYRPQQQLHSRSLSMSVPQPHSANPQSYAMNSIEENHPNSSRRMSSPASSMARNDVTRNLSPTAVRPSLSTQLSTSSQHGHSAIGDDGEPLSTTSTGPPTQSYFDLNQQYGFGPLTMNLPQDSKQLLGPALNTSDPFASMLMGGGSTQPSGYYGYGSPGPVQKPEMEDTIFQAMDTTLAPNALSVNQEAGDSIHATGEVPNQSFADMQEFGFPGSQNSSNGEKSANAAETSWEAFIDDKSWTENAT